MITVLKILVADYVGDFFLILEIFPMPKIDNQNLKVFDNINRIRDGSYFILIWLSRRYDSTMLQQHSQNANSPIKIYNLTPPRQANYDKKDMPRSSLRIGNPL